MLYKCIVNLAPFHSIVLACRWFYLWTTPAYFQILSGALHTCLRYRRCTFPIVPLLIWDSREVLTKCSWTGRAPLRELWTCDADLLYLTSVAASFVLNSPILLQVPTSASSLLHVCLARLRALTVCAQSLCSYGHGQVSTACVETVRHPEGHADESFQLCLVSVKLSADYLLLQDLPIWWTNLNSLPATPPATFSIHL